MSIPIRDLRSDLTDMARSLERIPMRSSGRQVMVVGVSHEEDASSVAASLAVLMSGRATRSSWLVDLDLVSNRQFEAFRSGAFSRIGQPRRAFDASLNTKPFYQVVPELRVRDGKQQQPKYFGVMQIGSSKLMVSRFRTDLLHSRQHVQISNSGDYWYRLRDVADWAIVDAPPLDVSRAGLSVCRHMDGVICVVTADKTRADEIAALRSEIEAQGGFCLGVVVLDIKMDARIADRISL